MISKTEQSLIDALSYCGLRELPEKDDKESVWIYALAKVQKADGSISYVLMTKDSDANDKIKKDFGNVAIIRKILEVYPYAYLKQGYMPKFKTQGKEERVKYLSRLNDGTDWSAMTVKQLDKKILALSIQKQIQIEYNKI